MLALTVRQPWADLIMAGAKDVENRTWSTEHRGHLLIHAGLVIDLDAHRKHGRTLKRRSAEDYPTGVLLGVVELLDVRRDSRSRWAQRGAWHWVIAHPQRFAPIEVRGQQGLWSYDFD